MDDLAVNTDQLVQRFYDQLIGVNPGVKRMGYQHAEHTGSSRTLLAVEAKALQARMANVQAKAQFVEFAQAHLHDQVVEELLDKLNNIQQVIEALFDPGSEFYPLLDQLSAHGVTVNKLDPLVSQVPWLKDELLRLINQPQYRKRTGSGAMIKDVKTALRFLGVESLQLIIPVYAMRRMLPHATTPFNGLKNRLWDYTLGVAIAARRLAQNSAEVPFNAFCAGLFHTLGHAVVIRTYLRTFTQVKQQLLLKAREERNTALTDALDSLEPDASFLSDAMHEFAAVLSADITSRWQLTQLPLCQTLDQMAEGIGFNGLGPLAKLVQQAQTYVQWQHLADKNNLGEDDTQAWFNAVQLGTEATRLLENTDLTRLGIEL